MEKPRMTSGLFSLGNFVSAGTISHAIPSGVIGILIITSQVFNSLLYNERKAN